MIPNRILYHADCPDGFCAAWVAWTKLDFEKTAFVDVRYQEDPPILGKEDRVLIVDFSYPRAVLEKLRLSVAELVVLDHHKTSAEDLNGFPGSTFDMTKSGARLAWEFFYPDLPAPKIVEYAEDRDLWRWKLPSSKEVSAYILSHGFDYVRWDQVARELENDFPSCVDQGVGILRERTRAVEMLCENAGVMDIGGYFVPVVNTQTYISEVANELCKRHPQARFAACYFDVPGSKRKWSLRSTSGFDVSEVAKRYGGGGHPAAAGFSADL